APAKRWGCRGPLRARPRARNGPPDLFGPVLRRSVGAREIARGVDQRHVGEGLRKIPEEPSMRRIVLLGEQPDVVAERDEPLEDLARLRAAPLQRQVVGEPERAGEECAFAGWQTIEVGVGRISMDEA